MLGKIIAILAVSSFATGEDLSLESYTSDLKPSALDLVRTKLVKLRLKYHTMNKIEILARYLFN